MDDSGLDGSVEEAAGDSPEVDVAPCDSPEVDVAVEAAEVDVAPCVEAAIVAAGVDVTAGGDVVSWKVATIIVILTSTMVFLYQRHQK